MILKNVSMFNTDANKTPIKPKEYSKYNLEIIKTEQDGDFTETIIEGTEPELVTFLKEKNGFDYKAAKDMVQDAPYRIVSDHDRTTGIEQVLNDILFPKGFLPVHMQPRENFPYERMWIPGPEAMQPKIISSSASISGIEIGGTTHVSFGFSISKEFPNEKFRQSIWKQHTVITAECTPEELAWVKQHADHYLKMREDIIAGIRAVE